MAFMRNQTRFIFAACLLLLIWTSAAGAPARLADYQSRIERARAAASELLEDEKISSESLAAIKRLVPKQEEVQFDGRVVRVENVWLHQALDEAAKKSGDEKGRKLILNEIADRLSALQASVGRSQQSAGSEDKSVQLKNILARPEYRLDEEKDSYINRLIRRLTDAILRSLESLVLRAGKASDLPSQGVSSISRLLLVMILLAAAAIGAIKLITKLHRTRRPDESEDARLILGEELDPNLTAEDLLAGASDLAKQGDFRTAIRRVYIALLLELEWRGKLPLHPAKTNRDYLSEMQSQPQLFPAFSAMTGTYESTWYGERGASEEEYQGFVSEYDNAVGQVF